MTFQPKDTGSCIGSNGDCRYCKLFYAKQSIISVAVALIPGIVLMAAAFLTGEQIGYGDAAVVTLMGCL